MNWIWLLHYAGCVCTITVFSVKTENLWHISVHSLQLADTCAHVERISHLCDNSIQSVLLYVKQVMRISQSNGFPLLKCYVISHNMFLTLIRCSCLIFILLIGIKVLSTETSTQDTFIVVLAPQSTSTLTTRDSENP